MWKTARSFAKHERSEIISEAGWEPRRDTMRGRRRSLLIAPAKSWISRSCERPTNVIFCITAMRMKTQAWICLMFVLPVSCCYYTHIHGDSGSSSFPPLTCSCKRSADSWSSETAALCWQCHLRHQLSIVSAWCVWSNVSCFLLETAARGGWWVCFRHSDTRNGV